MCDLRAGVGKTRTDATYNTCGGGIDTGCYKRLVGPGDACVPADDRRRPRALARIAVARTTDDEAIFGRGEEAPLEDGDVVVVHAVSA